MGVRPKKIGNNVIGLTQYKQITHFWKKKIYYRILIFKTFLNLKSLVDVTTDTLYWCI